MIFNIHYTRRRIGFLFKLHPDGSSRMGLIICRGSGTVDWGDGTTEDFAPGQELSTPHQYEALGWYQIQITADSLEYFHLSNFLTSSLPYAGGVIILAPFPADIFGGVESFAACFARLRSLYVPSDLFINCTGAKNFYACFAYSALQQIPDLSCCTGIENLSHCFYGCAGATGEAPPLWEVFDDDVPHDSCFYGCTSLSNYDEIPDDWK